MKFAQTKAFKNFMSKLYGWGAAIVIVGALFKIQHYPGAGIMLTIGLGVEAIIFFFSAFEKPHEEPDWTLVYPELGGIDSEDQLSGRDRDQLARSGGFGIGNTGVQNITLSNTLDKMLEEAKIGPELIQNLSTGLQNLSNNAAKLADITNAGVVTYGYIQNMEAASQSVLELSQSYKNTSEYLKHDLSLAEEYAGSLRNALSSMNQLSQTYQETAETAKEQLTLNKQYADSIRSITGYTNELAANYSHSSELLVRAVEALEKSSHQGELYTDQMQKTAQNLEALNAVYELQLQAADAQYQSTGKIKGAVESLVDSISNSANGTREFQEQIANLNKNIAALNNVYGNMLSAMNFSGGR